MKKGIAICMSIVLLSSLIGCASTDSIRSRDSDSSESSEKRRVPQSESSQSNDDSQSEFVDVSDESDVGSVPDLDDVEGTYNFFFGNNSSSLDSSEGTSSSTDSSNGDVFAGLSDVLKNIQSTTEFADSLNIGSDSGSSSQSVSSKGIGSSSKSSSSLEERGNSSYISESNLLQNAETYLNNKYIFTFHAVDVVNWAYMDSDHVLVKAYRDKKPEYYFSVVCDLSGYKSGASTISFAENYTACSVKNSIASSFESSLSHEKTPIDSAVSADFGYGSMEDWVNSYGDTNYLIYTHDYIEKHNVESIYLQVVVDGSKWNSAKEESLINSLENTSYSYKGIELIVKVYFSKDLDGIRDKLRQEIPLSGEFIDSYGKAGEPLVLTAMDGKRTYGTVDDIVNVD